MAGPGDTLDLDRARAVSASFIPPVGFSQGDVDIVGGLSSVLPLKR